MTEGKKEWTAEAFGRPLFFVTKAFSIISHRGSTVFQGGGSSIPQTENNLSRKTQI